MPRMSFFEDFIGRGYTAVVANNNPAFAFTFKTNASSWCYAVGNLSTDEGGGGVVELGASGDNGFYSAIVLEQPRLLAKRQPTLGIRAKNRDDHLLTHQDLYFGLSTYGSQPNGANDFIGFYRTSGATTGTWQCYHKVAGSLQSTDTLIAADQEIWHDFEVQLTPLEAVWIIDGRIVWQLTRNAPTGELWFVVQDVFKILDQSATFRTFNLDYAYGSQER